MSTRRRRAASGVLLELWRPPANAGDPVGCLATTYTFRPGLFDEQCLARFLEIESEPDREDLAFLLERESRLGSVYAGVLVDHTKAGVEHSLRWDVLPVRVRAGKQHAKLSLLAWSHHIRIIVASANLTEPGYRTNHEVAAAVDLSPAEADGDLLMHAIDFLRGLLALVPGAQDDTPVVQRASAYLSQVERQAETWKRPRRKTVVRRQLACTLPVIVSGTDARSSLDEAVAMCRQRGGSPHEAWVASPFFDVDDGSGRVAAALCKSMARGRTREIRFCVPASRDDSEIAVPRLAAPKAIATTPLEYRGHVTVSTLPALDGDKNLRPWHAKMLALRGDSYTALIIGSSNFTCAGMGTASYQNAEANLVTVVERVAYGREAGRLETVWSQMGPGVDLNAAEWLGPQPESDEDDGAVAPPVPAGFVSATYRAGDERTIVLRLDPAHLPSEWRIHACGRDAREILTRSAWAETDSRTVVTVHWSPVQPPDRLLVSWDGQEAFLPLNVEDAHQLPPPARLERMSADDMLWILAAADPSAAIRPARDRTSTPPAMPGVPDRHRPPASRRPDPRRRVQKRALADLAPGKDPKPASSAHHALSEPLKHREDVDTEPRRAHQHDDRAEQRNEVHRQPRRREHQRRGQLPSRSGSAGPAASRSGSACLRPVPVQPAKRAREALHRLVAAGIASISAQLLVQDPRRVVHRRRPCVEISRVLSQPSVAAV